MVFGWFPWFFKVVSWFFMFFGWFPWYCWLRTPQKCILAQRSSLGLWPSDNYDDDDYIAILWNMKLTSLDCVEMGGLISLWKFWITWEQILKIKILNDDLRPKFLWKCQKASSPPSSCRRSAKQETPPTPDRISSFCFANSQPLISLSTMWGLQA